MTLAPHEIAFVLDLRRPVAAQISRFRAVAKYYHARFNSAAGTRLQSGRKYSLYLQILDAIEAGETPVRIQAKLFADHQGDRSALYRDTRNAAMGMRDTGYKKLLGAA